MKALLLFACTILGASALAQDRHAEHPLFMKKAPAIKTLDAIGTPHLSAAPGKVILVDFFATYCGPCIAAFPDLKDVKRQYGDRVEIVGVAKYLGYYEMEKNLKPAEELQRMKGFMAKHGVEWPVIIGPDSNFKNYSISAIPTVIVIDETGTIRGAYVGCSSEFPRRIRKLLDKIFSQPKAASKT